MADLAIRTLPLAGAHGGSSSVRLEPAQPARRISLRAGAEAVAALSTALGVNLPTEPKTSASHGSCTALWLGPDEWLVIDEGAVDINDSGTGVANGLIDAAAGTGVAHSATDVSHRNTAIHISGPAAADVLNGGCPLDLSLTAFPVGACARTLFGKIEVVLLRTGEKSFRLECWRSFSEYAFGLLRQSTADL